jgi:hypothetical protein
MAEYEPGSKFMRVEDAIELVLELARGNSLTSEDSAQFASEPELEAEQERQSVSIGTIEDFFANVVTEGRLVDLKEVLMKMGNNLVTRHGFGPHAGGDRDPTWRNTCPIGDLAVFINHHEEAREVLRDLGFDWSMPDGTQGQEGDHLQGA